MLRNGVNVTFKAFRRTEIGAGNEGLADDLLIKKRHSSHMCTGLIFKEEGKSKIWVLVKGVRIYFPR